jgi:hypothetical protein
MLTIETTETLVVEVSTGEEVASFGTTVPWDTMTRCGSDGEVLIACTVMDEEGIKLATVRIDDREAGVSGQQIPSRSINGVDGERVRVGRAYDPSVVVDPAGNIIDEEPPGELVAVSDHYAVVRDEREHVGDMPGYAVYRLAD